MTKILHNFYYCLAIPVEANKTEFKLEPNSPLQRGHITGIQVRPKTTGAKSINGNDLVDTATLVASFLTLKQRNAEVFEKIPLELVALATAEGKWYEIDLPLIDMAQSNILCTNEAALTAGQDYEIVFRYQKVINQ